MRNNIRGFVIGGFIASGLGALAVNIPFTFSAGSAIKASDINANFGSLKTAVDALEGAPVKTDETLTGNGAVTSKLGLKIPLTIKATSDAYPLEIINNTGLGIYVTTKATAVTAASQDIAIVGASANEIGMVGTTRAGDGRYGVKGESYSTTGLTGGVYGKADSSPVGTGVVGHGGVTGGFFEAKGGVSGDFQPTGVYGVANQNMGTGVQGIGATWGGRFKGSIGLQVEGTTGISVSSKDNGSTLVLNQNGNGALINAFLPNSKRFIVDASGNISTPGNLVANGVTYTSDRNAKTNFSSINALEVLSKVTRLNISRWNYKSEASSLQHVGPMAQDFHAAFGLNGKDDKHLSAVDMQGVAFAAIQGLNQKLEQKTAKISDLESKLAMLESRLAALEKK